MEQQLHFPLFSNLQVKRKAKRMSVSTVEHLAANYRQISKTCSLNSLFSFLSFHVDPIKYKNKLKSKCKFQGFNNSLLIKYSNWRSISFSLTSFLANNKKPILLYRLHRKSYAIITTTTTTNQPIIIDLVIWKKGKNWNWTRENMKGQMQIEWVVEQQVQ